ncbi:MAG TPA: YhcH/YjgK/YiaL family protein [Clostridia bacterium]|nr:MAG: Toxin-antitoxin biofilm protein TabA [Firmicutes bacterium ADurb.Bin146]HOD93796.1 YhcH/YjgK/YiaL family protein [Clostridia bacterium]
MINGNLDGTGIPSCLDDYLKRSIELMKNLDVKSPVGRVMVDGDDFYYTVMEVEVNPISEIKFEMHKKYIDIHYLIKGSENIGIANGRKLGILVPYLDDKDCSFCKDGDSMSIISMEEKDFCVIYPYEAHKPGGMSREFGKIKKAVFKIKI